MEAGSRKFINIQNSLYAAEGAEPAVNRQAGAGGEHGGGRAEVNDAAQQFFRLAVTFHGRPAQDILAAGIREHARRLVDQVGILQGREEAGADFIDAIFGEWFMAMSAANHLVKLLMPPWRRQAGVRESGVSALMEDVLIIAPSPCWIIALPKIIEGMIVPMMFKSNVNLMPSTVRSLK